MKDWIECFLWEFKWNSNSDWDSIIMGYNSYSHPLMYLAISKINSIIYIDILWGWFALKFMEYNQQ